MRIGLFKTRIVFACIALCLLVQIFCLGVVGIGFLISATAAMYVYWIVVSIYVSMYIRSSRREGLLAEMAVVPEGEHYYIRRQVFRKIVQPACLGMALLCLFLPIVGLAMSGIESGAESAFSPSTIAPLGLDWLVLIVYALLLLSSLCAIGLLASHIAYRNQATGSSAQLQYPDRFGTDYVARYRIPRNWTIFILATCALMPLPYSFLVLLVLYDYIYLLAVFFAASFSSAIVAWFLLKSAQTPLGSKSYSFVP